MSENDLHSVADAEEDDRRDRALILLAAGLISRETARQMIAGEPLTYVGVYGCLWISEARSIDWPTILEIQDRLNTFERHMTTFSFPAGPNWFADYEPTSAPDPEDNET